MSNEQPKMGDKGTCQSCSEPIVYNGEHWRHTGTQYRHVASPAILGARQKLAEKVVADPNALSEALSDETRLPATQSDVFDVRPLPGSRPRPVGAEDHEVRQLPGNIGRPTEFPDVKPLPGSRGGARRIEL